MQVTASFGVAAMLIFVFPTDWPKDDDIELFNRIRQALPKDDVMKYDSRVNHLDWDAVIN